MTNRPLSQAEARLVAMWLKYNCNLTLQGGFIVLWNKTPEEISTKYNQGVNDILRAANRPASNNGHED